MELESLPTFPCSKAKTPLAGSRGFKDARPHKLREMRGWPLVGVATGEASGIDVLDIDPDGVAFFNEVPIPATRHQFTRRGIHVYFRHCPGLRNSSGRVRGTDVRADGGHAIWWEREGFDVVWPDLIVDWPGWLLGMIEGQCLHGRASRDGGLVASAVVPPWREGARSAGRIRNPGAVLRWHADRLAEAGPGGRSAALLSAAVAMGGPVRAGRIPVEQVRATLGLAAERCGLVADYGEAKVARTIENGLNWQPPSHSGERGAGDQQAYRERSERP